MESILLEDLEKLINLAKTNKDNVIKFYENLWLIGAVLKNEDRYNILLKMKSVINDIYLKDKF